MSMRILIGTAVIAGAAMGAAAKPDILFIAIDDMNDWIGCLGGHPQSKTPNLDRLAARGTLFTNAHCAAPACNPSRAALMSGLRPFTSGVFQNGSPAGAMLRDTLPLNRFMLQQGYLVLGGGKIYHGTNPESSGDVSFWSDYWRRESDPHPPVKSVSGLNRSHFDWGPLDCADEEMGDYKLVSWAAEMLHQNHDKPLFLAVGFVKPHLPWYVPQKYFDRYPLETVQLPAVKEDDLDDVPPAGVVMAKPDGDHKAVVDGAQWSHAVRGYLATLAFVDDQIGRLMEAVDSSGRAKDLVIVLWSDHGWHLGEKQHWRKFALWERATKAPMMVVAPGLTKPGARCEAPVDFMSIYPTVADLAGLPIPPHVEGPSLRPLLADPDADWPHLSLCTHIRGNHAVRDRHWRYIRYADGSEELYDHRTDPNEWANLASDPKFNDVKARLAAPMPADEAPDTAGVKKGGDSDSGKRGKSAKGGGGKKK